MLASLSCSAPSSLVRPFVSIVSFLVSSPGRFVPSSTRSVAVQCLCRACAWSPLYQPSQILTFSVTSVLSLWPSPRARRSYLDLPYFSVYFSLLGHCVSPTHWVPNGAMSSVCSPTSYFLRPPRFPRAVGPPALLAFMVHAFPFFVRLHFVSSIALSSGWLIRLVAPARSCSAHD